MIDFSWSTHCGLGGQLVGIFGQNTVLKFELETIYRAAQLKTY